MKEILIQEVYVDPSTIKVTPTQCPGADRDDILRDKNSNPTCVLDYKVCKYLDEVFFEIDKHEESLYCKVK